DQVAVVGVQRHRLAAERVHVQDPPAVAGRVLDVAAQADRPEAAVGEPDVDRRSRERALSVAAELEPAALVVDPVVALFLLRCGDRAGVGRALRDALQLGVELSRRTLTGFEVDGDGGTGDEEPEDCETEEDPSTHPAEASVPAAPAVMTVRAHAATPITPQAIGSSKKPA